MELKAMVMFERQLKFLHLKFSDRTYREFENNINDGSVIRCGLL
jgi:hypothetical protein